MTISWFKLYHELPDDIKIRRFTAQEKWAWVALLCLASKSKQRGVITCEMEDIAYYCEFACPQDWLYYRDKLIAKGMLEINADGNLQVLNWEDRQASKPSDKPEAIKARVSKHRAKNKTSNETRCNALQTPLKRECNATDKIREEEDKKEEYKTNVLHSRREADASDICDRASDSISQESEVVPVEEIPSTGDVGKKTASQIKREWFEQIFCPNYPYRLTQGGVKVRDIGKVIGKRDYYLKMLPVSEIESGRASQALRDLIAAKLQEYRTKNGKDPDKVMPAAGSHGIWAFPFICDPCKWFSEKKWLSHVAECSDTETGVENPAFIEYLAKALKSRPEYRDVTVTNAIARVWLAESIGNPKRQAAIEIYRQDFQQQQQSEPIAPVEERDRDLEDYIAAEHKRILENANVRN